MVAKYESQTVCSVCSYVCICLSFCLSLCQEVREQAPISKAPRHFVTQWAVKMLIQRTHTHTQTHTQDIQQAGSRVPVGSNSCSGHCAPGKAGACWIFHYSLIYCLTNPVITESKPSSHTHTHTLAAAGVSGVANLPV